MDLTREPGDVLPPDPRPCSEEVEIMSDFEMLYLFLTFCLVIIGIINLLHKK